MNRRIPNGAWCLFRGNPGGTRQGKVVVVQHRASQIPTPGAIHVKLYASEKQPSEDGGWAHERITLRPDSDQPGYEPSSFKWGDDGELLSHSRNAAGAIGG